MVEIDNTPPTIAAIRAQYERDAEDWRRDHLGASMIGRECWRLLWYSFRWAVKPEHSGRLLRLFATGHLQESRITADLRAIGIEINDEVAHMLLAPHFGGTPDALGRGFLEAPKSWHIVEYKTASRKSFTALVAKGVRLSKPEHFAQMQIYMHGKGLENAVYLCVCKDDDEMHFERIKYDRSLAEGFIAKAGAIIDATEPPSKISQDPSWYQCKFCDYRGACHQGSVETLERNCRTCLSSTPNKDGTWGCDLLKITLSPERQREGCLGHLFIPAMIGEVVDVSEEDRWVRYKTSDGFVTDRNKELTREKA